TATRPHHQLCSDRPSHTAHHVTSPSERGERSAVVARDMSVSLDGASVRSSGQVGASQSLTRAEVAAGAVLSRRRLDRLVVRLASCAACPVPERHVCEEQHAHYQPPRAQPAADRPPARRVKPKCGPLDPVPRYRVDAGGMQTHEVAEQAGVNTQTLRYYERRGLLAEPPRSPAGYRDYPTSAVDVLRLVQRAQGLGFSLAQGEEMLALARRRPGSSQAP